MAFIKSSIVKLLAVGLASLADAAPFNVTNQTTTQQTVTKITIVRVTSTSTRVHIATATLIPSANITTTNATTETAKITASLTPSVNITSTNMTAETATITASLIPNITTTTKVATPTSKKLLPRTTAKIYDSDHPSEDDNVVKAEQLSKLQFETTDPELAEPTGNTTANLTKIELLNSVLKDNNNNNRSFPSAAAGTKLGLFDRPMPRFQPQVDVGGIWVGLINATPYRWQMSSVKTWNIKGNFAEKLAHSIDPGQSVSAIAWTRELNSRAEAVYRLVGTREESWFTLNIAEDRPHRITVEYGGALRTVGNANGTAVVDLGVHDGVVSPAFVLAGAEGRFFANDIDTAWMRATLPEIGTRTLREVTLPRSHHSGMYALTKRLGLGNAANTLTQDYDVYTQMARGGVRVIDCRPAIGKNGSVFEAHGTKLLGLYHGGLGITQAELVRQVNQFNDDHPGELVIIDVDGSEMRDGRKWFNPMDAAAVAEVVEGFTHLKHRAYITPGKDLSHLPLNRLIGGGESAVIVRMEESRIRDVPSWPGAREGFVTSAELPLRKRYSDAGNGAKLLSDQVRALRQARVGGAKWPLYGSEFIVTLMGLELVLGASITEVNRQAWDMLVERFWPAFADDFYPNWITMDAVRGDGLRAVAVAVNQCFVAKRCGTLSGRVSAAKEFVLNAPLAARDVGEVLNGTVSVDKTVLAWNAGDDDDDDEAVDDDDGSVETQDEMQRAD
ncbi:LysM domain-containing protein [Cordyceps fumosorosea ARSEF 2679]|uniref:LysM domain-containing protein n=1 Tax=Cordyceps fumosorosea (strain ARSEF 2679) TaxID=1081104 RepID=A0A167JT19_CORFA|nr:LysM domain-containing protein [Cordyceps fumosorosea ARSEF 2679]OAA50712.1 LysM domain-containing protein [Cordyceps fumosorosea ARSEF 2679]